MNLKDLKNISQFKHISEYRPEELITKLSLYEKVLITTCDVVHQKENRGGVTIERVYVSPDVCMLHEFYMSEGKMELPCPECNTDRPFELEQAWNPRMVVINTRGVLNAQLTSSIPVPQNLNGESAGQHYNVFEKQAGRPYYNFGNNHLADAELLPFEDSISQMYMEECGSKCMVGIMKTASEFRKNFICTMDDRHRGHVDFILVPAVSEKPDELINYEKRCEETEKAGTDICVEQTEEECCAEEMYNKLSHALFIIKVGQYPALKNMQLFDTKKYRGILRKKYQFYTLAIALYEEGVGIGAIVYIRRILENLVEEIHQECVKECNSNDTFDEESYTKLSFKEKITYLEKNYGKRIIPSELQPIRHKIYGVISDGVHNASEEICLEMFPYMKFVIEVILDDRIQRKEREKKLGETIKKIQGMNG